jgi:Uncharacterised protein family (UPF0182)
MIEKRTIAEQPGPFAGKKGSAPGKHPPFRHLLGLVIAAAVLLDMVLGIITGYVEKWLWMRQLDYAGIFWTLLSVQWAMFCSAFVFAFLYLWLNLRQAVRNGAAFREDGRAERPANLSGADAAAQDGDGGSRAPAGRAGGAVTDTILCRLAECLRRNGASKCCGMRP